MNVHGPGFLLDGPEGGVFAGVDKQDTQGRCSSMRFANSILMT